MELADAEFLFNLIVYSWRLAPDNSRFLEMLVPMLFNMNMWM
jgi:hypothetical protein